MDNRSYSESVDIARPADQVYALVSDVTRMGEWSPVCKACWWEDESDKGVGAWFTGRNESGDRTWETKSQVVAAEPGVEFAFTVGGDRTRWGYRFESVDGGTRVTESWDFLPANVEVYKERFGDDVENQIANRHNDAQAGIRSTLASIKQAAEAS